MFDSFNNCLIVVRYGFNLVFVVRMVLDVRLNWLYDVKKVQRHPIHLCHYNGVFICSKAQEDEENSIER